MLRQTMREHPCSKCESKVTGRCDIERHVKTNHEGMIDVWTPKLLMYSGLELLKEDPNEYMNESEETNEYINK